MEYMISIDGTAVEDEVADNMYQRLEWDWTIYSKQLEHVQLYICSFFQPGIGNFFGHGFSAVQNVLRTVRNAVDGIEIQLTLLSRVVIFIPEVSADARDGHAEVECTSVGHFIIADNISTSTTSARQILMIGFIRCMIKSKIRKIC